jgi:hypothetical protein
MLELVKLWQAEDVPMRSLIMSALTLLKWQKNFFRCV